jgi:hypothetical protein
MDRLSKLVCTPLSLPLLCADSFCLDFEYYLANQVLPSIERLCEHIEGTEKARLAECLGESTISSYADRLLTVVRSQDSTYSATAVRQRSLSESLRLSNLKSPTPSDSPTRSLSASAAVLVIRSRSSTG